jgi:hypothetical protein
MEVVKLVGICSAAYSRWPEAGKEEAVISLWENMFSDVDYETCAWAVKRFISESVYPPTVADIRSRIADMTVIQGKTGIEAWGDVKAAIRKFGSYREKDAMDWLDGSTRKVVEAIGFKTLCMSENEMADRAHFLKVYDTLEKRQREDALMLPDTRRRLQERRDLLKLEG